jgi:hypothetical protein
MDEDEIIPRAVISPLAPASRESGMAATAQAAIGVGNSIPI